MFVPVLKTILEDPVREALEDDNENNDKIFDLAEKWPLEKPLEKLTLRPVKERKPTPPAFLTLSPDKSKPAQIVPEIKIENTIKDLSPEERMLLASLSNDSNSIIHLDENNQVNNASDMQLSGAVAVSGSGSVAVSGSSRPTATKWNQVANFFKNHLKRSKTSVNGDESKAASTKSSNSGSTTPKVSSARNSPKEIFKSIFGGKGKGKKKNPQESIVSSNTSSNLRNDDNADADDDDDAAFMKEEMGPSVKGKKKLQSVIVEPLQKPALFISEAPVKISDFSDEQNLDYARWERRNDFISYISGKKQFCKEFSAKYKVKQILGDGAFGFVVVAETLRDKKEVAVKFMIKTQIMNWVKIKKTQKIPVEIYLLQNLNHPNIIRFLDSFSDEKYFYLVTELHGTPWHPHNPKLDPRTHVGLRTVPNIKNQGNSLLTFVPRFNNPQVLAGIEDIDVESIIKSSEQSSPCDLFECIDAHRAFPVSVARSIFRQLVNAVSYLNQMGIVHRDLKEENIVIDENYRIKFIDFGAAWWIPASDDEKNWFNNLNGTPEYAAPEVLRGEPYRGPEAEIWALGILLFTIVYRQSPFHSVDQVLQGDLQYPFLVHSSLKEFFEIKPICSSTTDVQDVARVDEETLTFDYEKVLERKYGVDGLIKGLLEVDVAKRSTLSDILSHPWLTQKFPKEFINTT